MSAIFCGIDVSADSCVVLCVDQSGQPLGQSRTFSNDLAGAGELTAFLAAGYPAGGRSGGYLSLRGPLAQLPGGRTIPGRFGDESLRDQS
ncbi:MAG: hypothetical protein AB1774_12115, partial [Bacillota bacterium]